MTPRPGRAPGAHLPPRRDRRRDGRGAAAGRVQPEHQGAGRLLGGGVHRRRRAARAGRAHPGAPRVDAGVGARRHRRLRAASSDPATRWWSTTPSPAARTSTTSPSSRPPSPTARLVGWAANRAHHADVGGAAPGSIPADATEIQQEGLRIPPTALQPRSCGASCWPPRARPTSGPATSTRSSAPTVVGCGAPRRHGRRAARRGRRLRRAPHARGARRPARRSLELRGRARLDRGRAGPAAPGTDRRDGDARGRGDHLRLHRHRPAERAATSTRSRR